MVAVVGDTHLDSRGRKFALAVVLGKALVDTDYRIVTGGLGDLPKALAKGARKSNRYSDGSLIAILPSYDPSTAGSVADIVVATGLDHARNLLVANSDAVIAIGGGAGTLSEIALAWALKRLIIAFRVPGWSGKVAGLRIDDRIRYPEIKDDRVYEADSVPKAIETLNTLLSKYNMRHSRIFVGRKGAKSSRQKELL